MKLHKKFALIGAAALVISVTSISALAASSYQTPAEIVAGLTGKTVESVTTEKMETGETYGSLAEDYGVLDEFQAQSLEAKKAYLEERVASGAITQERADTILAAIESHQANCDGLHSGGSGAEMGAGFGGGNGTGMGTGYGRGNGNAGGGRNGLGCSVAP